MRISDWSSDVCSSDLMYFGKSAETMREHGIRTITDLKMLDDAGAVELAEKSSATKSAASMARRRAQQDGAVEFLESPRCTLVAGHAIKQCPDSPPEFPAAAARPQPTAVPDADRVVETGRTPGLNPTHHFQSRI